MSRAVDAAALGRALRDLRSAKGWSQAALADRAGLHRTYVAELEAGKRNPTLTTLVKVSGALGVPASALLAEAEIRASEPGRD